MRHYGHSAAPKSVNAQESIALFIPITLRQTVLMIACPDPVLFSQTNDDEIA